MKIKLGYPAYAALVILVGEGEPMSADNFGARLWRDKKRGRVTSSNGGGDYAAQCFLGKLKRDGYVRHAPSEGCTLWEITPAGRNALAAALNASGAPGEVRQLLRTTNAGGRVVGPRELASDIKRGRTGQRGIWRRGDPVGK